MKMKIAVEEHFLLAGFENYFGRNRAAINPALFEKAVPVLKDFGEIRQKAMADAGVEKAVLSLSGPGVQAEPDRDIAVRLARQANDALAAQIVKRPASYAGFAHLAMQDAAAAADELERCIRDLGFVGGMVNGNTGGVYLDDPRYDVFWERLEALDVPLYIHPADHADRPHMYDGQPSLWGPTWSWGVETCTHALRLVFRGTFDRYPGAKIILGHMGETLPIQLWRLDSRFAISNQLGPLKLRPSEYIRRNVMMTTAGVCDDAALRCAIDAVGLGNLMFSVDFPFESSREAGDWFDAAKISERERAAVGRDNAARLLKL